MDEVGGGQRRPQWGHDIGESTLREDDHIEIALHHNSPPSLFKRLPGLIQTKKNIFFSVEGMFGRVHVLGAGPIGKNSPAKSDRRATLGPDGNNQPAIHEVSGSTTSHRSNESKELHFLQPFRAGFAKQWKRTGGRKTQTEAFRSFFGNLTFFEEIVPGRSSVRRKKGFTILSLKLPIKPETNLLSVSYLGRSRPIWRLNTGPIPEKLKRFRKTLVLESLNETKNIPTRLTTKTVKKLPFGINLKRRGLFFVKWAKSHPYPAPLS